MSPVAPETDTLPLAGIRVLDLGHTVMGPACAMVLADLGADVIKVEPPDGERTRATAGFGAGIFPVFNRNKRSLSVDIRQAAGKAVLCRLFERADVLVENFSHGTLDRLGLGWAALSAKYPRLIYCNLKGFLHGPYEQRPALDEVVQYMGGLAYMTGPAGRPLRAGASVVDIMGGLFGALGVVAALSERERTGRGQEVRSALFESTAFMVAQHMGQQALTGIAPPPMPEKAAAWGIYDSFDTADARKIFIGVTSDRQWQRFCAAFALDELATDPLLATNTQRAQQHRRLARIVAGLAARHGYDALAAKLDTAGIPYAPLARPGDLFDDPHLNAGGRLLEIRLPNGALAKLPGLPLDMDGRGPRVRRQPPATGEHTQEVLLEAGYTETEISQLASQRVIVLAQPAPGTST